MGPGSRENPAPAETECRARPLQLPPASQSRRAPPVQGRLKSTRVAATLSQLLSLPLTIGTFLAQQRMPGLSQRRDLCHLCSAGSLASEGPHGGTPSPRSCSARSPRKPLNPASRSVASSSEAPAGPAPRPGGGLVCKLCSAPPSAPCSFMQRALCGSGTRWAAWPGLQG